MDQLSETHLGFKCVNNLKFIPTSVFSHLQLPLVDFSLSFNLQTSQSQPLCGVLVLVCVSALHVRELGLSRLQRKE